MAECKLNLNIPIIRCAFRVLIIYPTIGNAYHSLTNYGLVSVVGDHLSCLFLKAREI